VINRAILEAQKQHYQKGREEALAALERAKANYSAFNGAIEACDNFLALLNNLESEASKMSNPPIENKQET